MKKIKKTSIIILSILFSTQILAGNTSATKRLNNVIKLIKNNCIETNFTLVAKQTSNPNNFITKGIFVLKGEKFIVKTKQMNIYFNGKTEWVYMPEINEVSISEPTALELAKINPITLLNIYKNNSIVSTNKKKSNNKIHTIELYPKDNQSDFKKIELKVLKSNHFPTFIRLIDKKGGITQLKLTKTKKKSQIKKEYFEFNTNKYKDIEINDLR